MSAALIGNKHGRQVLIRVALVLIISLLFFGTVVPEIVGSWYLNQGALCACRQALFPRNNDDICTACMPWLKRALQLGRSRDRAYRLLGHIMLESGRYKQAMQLFGDLARVCDRSGLDTYWLTLLQTLQGEELMSPDAIKRGVPSQFCAWQGRRYEIAGRNEMAAAARKLAYAIDRGWENEWERGWNARYVIDYFLSRQDLDAAQRAIRVALDSFRDVAGLEARAQVAWRLWDLGQVSERQGHFDTAIDAYRQSIRAYPAQALKSYLSLAQLLKVRGSGLDDIEHEFRSFISDATRRDPHIYAWPVSVFIKLDSPQHAHRFLEEAEPQQRETSILLGITARLYKTEDQLDQAAIFYRRAIAMARVDNLADPGKLIAELDDTLRKERRK